MMEGSLAMEFWEKAGEKVKDAALIATEKTFEAGGLLKKGAGNLRDKAVEDWKMKKEIERINDFCNQIRQKFEIDRNQFESDFQRETEQFLHIRDEIEQRLPTYNAIITYIEQNQNNIMHMPATGKNGTPFVFDRDIDPKTGDSIKIAGAAGLATGLGTVGLVTAFCSASTGTALSALTGSAYIHATLAALGGGSLAVGGFGMVGGAIVLGTAFLAPTVGVGGYLLDKQIRKAYEEAISRKGEALVFKKEQRIFFQTLRKGFQSFRKLNYEFYAFYRFFDELLNMSIPAFAIGINSDYERLVKKSVEIIHFFANIPIIIKNKINVHLDKDVHKIVMQVNECKSWLGILLRSLGMEEAEMMNKARYQEVDVETAEEIVNLVKELRDENGWKDSKIKNQESTINKQADKITEQEIEIQKKNEEILKLADELRLKNPTKYITYERELLKEYDHLEGKALQFAASGELFYELVTKNESEGLDYSAVIIEYSNCIEELLKDLLNRSGIPISENNGTPYFGTIIKQGQKYNLLEKEYCSLLWKLNDCRIAAAHGFGVNKDKMEKVKGYLFIGDSKRKKGLLEYFNELLLNIN